MEIKSKDKCQSLNITWHPLNIYVLRLPPRDKLCIGIMTDLRFNLHVPNRERAQDWICSCLVMDWIWNGVLAPILSKWNAKRKLHQSCALSLIIPNHSSGLANVPEFFCNLDTYTFLIGLKFNFSGLAQDFISTCSMEQKVAN